MIEKEACVPAKRKRQDDEGNTSAEVTGTGGSNSAFTSRSTTPFITNFFDKISADENSELDSILTKVDIIIDSVILEIGDLGICYRQYFRQILRESLFYRVSA